MKKIDNFVNKARLYVELNTYLMIILKIENLTDAMFVITNKTNSEWSFN